jgi:hypothetical protein
MESQLEQRLRHLSKAQLLHLLQELALQHPSLQEEIVEILARLAPDTIHNSQDDHASTFDVDSLVLKRPTVQFVQKSLNRDFYLQRVTAYSTQIQQDGSAQAIFDDLVNLLQEAEMRADQYDYQQALDIYAIVLDERLAIHHPVLSTIFDRAIDEFMPGLNMLLSEISSTVTSYNPAPISPLLPAELRQNWLRRLFALWLKRTDAHRAEEHLPDMLLDVAWSDDIMLLRNLAQQELETQSNDDHSNIVDFSRQARTRILEKFLREIPSL